MNHKPLQKPARALKKSLILGSALLFIAAVAGCDMLSAADATGLSNAIRPSKHYPALRMQQGRVQLDADWNEQIEISDRSLR